MKKLLILAGGTGGHIIPALNIATYFRNNEFEIYWLGKKSSLEEKIAKKNNIPFYSINIIGVRRTSIKNWIKLPFLLLKSIYDSYKIIKKTNPDIIIGTGGYTAFPGYVAGFLARKKVCLQEQNTIMGLSNKLASYFVDKVFLPFTDTEEQLKNFSIQDGGAIILEKTMTNSKFVNIGGNPIDEALNYLPPKINDYSSLNLLILGGSLGAKAINQLIPQVLQKLEKHKIKINVVHQTGERDFLPTKSFYEQLNIDIKSLEIVPFLTDVVKYYTWANLFIGRSGAMTVSELSAVGIPSIFIPFPYATDNHQYHNAIPLMNENRAIIIKEDECNVDKLAEILDNTLSSGKINLTVKSARNFATKIIYTESMALL